MALILNSINQSV